MNCHYHISSELAGCWLDHANPTMSARMIQIVMERWYAKYINDQADLSLQVFSTIQKIWRRMAMMRVIQLRIAECGP